MNADANLSLDEMRSRLAEREATLADLLAALPKHSVRPHQMAEVEDVEDDVAALRAQLAEAGQAAGAPAADHGHPAPAADHSDPTTDG